MELSASSRLVRQIAIGIAGWSLGFVAGLVISQWFGLQLVWQLSEWSKFTDANSEAIGFAVVTFSALVASLALTVAATARWRRSEFISCALGLIVGGTWYYLVGIHSMGISFGGTPPP